MKKNSDLINPLTLIPAGGFLFITFLSLVMMFYAQPVADDFCRAAVDNWYIYTVEQYLTWTGRWAAMAIHSVILPNMDITQHYWILLVTLWVIFGISIYAFFDLLFQEASKTKVTLIFSLGLLSLYWAGLPDPGETVYWFTGGIENQLPLSLIVASVWFLWSSGKEEDNPTLRQTYALLALISALVVSGLHELAGVVLIVVLATGSTAALILNKNAPLWIMALLTALTGLLVSVLAPGNLERAEVGYESAWSLSRLPTILYFQFRSTFIPWVLDTKLLLASVIFVSHPFSQSVFPSWMKGDKSGIWRWLVPLAWLAALSGLAIALAIATGGLGPKRAQNFYYGVFIVGWFSTLFVWSRPRSKELLRTTAVTNQNSLLTLASSFLFIAALLTQQNVINASKDIVSKNSVFIWHETIVLRYKFLAEAKESGVVEVELPKNIFIPKTYLQRDIELDHEHWRNQCFADYFGLAKISIIDHMQELDGS